MGSEGPAADIELTILMPCLNEAATLDTCIQKAKGYLARHGIKGEILIADNGSTDGSPYIASAAGARVISVPTRGYGAALLGGIDAARGRYIIMGDADDSYDFGDLDCFMEKLRQGFDFVMGNRFLGGIKPGAMPMLNRYLGNPILSLIGALFFRTTCSDFHCGLRGFSRGVITDLGLVMPGMEFASEMVAKAAIRGVRMAEVPVVLSPDGRGRPPHLRRWRDGWRHLKFLLMFSPRWLYLYPGVVMSLGGLSSMTLLAITGSIKVFGVTLQVHSMLAGGIIGLLGIQTLSFALLARELAERRGFLPPSPLLASFWKQATVERSMLAGMVLLVGGTLIMFIAVLQWASIGFGSLDYALTMRVVVPSLVSMAIGLQLILGGFLAGLLQLPPIDKGHTATQCDRFDLNRSQDRNGHASN